VHHYNSTQYCKTETVFSMFPFLQTNITSQMWASGGKGGHPDWNGPTPTGVLIICLFFGLF